MILTSKVGFAEQNSNGPRYLGDSYAKGETNTRNEAINSQHTDKEKDYSNSSNSSSRAEGAASCTYFAEDAWEKTCRPSYYKQ